MTSRLAFMLSVILLAALCALVFHWEPAPGPFLHEDGSLRRPLDGLDAWRTHGQPLLALSLGGGVLLCLLQLRQSKDDHLPADEGLPGNTGILWRWLLIIVLFSAGIRAPLLTLEMHRDEQDTLAHHLLGRWKAIDGPVTNVRRPPSEAVQNPLYIPPPAAQKKVLELIDTPGRTKWQPVPWSETLVGNFIGNNSPVNSLLARLSNRLWQFFSGSQLRLFHLTALRIPVFLAMTAAAGVLFLLTLRWSGSKTVALLAGILFSLHPLVIRYGILCRGYAWLLLFMLLALLAWTHATSHPQRWWSWYLGALFNSMAVLSFPGFALPAVLLLGVTLAAVASSGRPVRWLVILSATCAGLLTVLPWLGTSWIQSAFAASYDYAYKRETLDWLPRFLGAGLCGLTVPDSELLPGLASSTPPDLWTEVWQVMPGSLATLVLITTWLVSFGISAIWKVNRLAACWMLALLAGATLTGLSAWYFAGRELLYWYAAYLSVLVPVALAAALGCQTGPRRPVAAGLALWFLIGTFPAGQRGRLDLVPPKRFEILCSRFARVFLVSDARGRTLEVSIR